MKKLRYIPGMFSIILLPLLGYIYFQSNGYFTQLTALDFVAEGFEEMKEWCKETNDIYCGKEYDKRIYKEISLNGNKEESQKAFQYIDNFVNKVIQTKDTINGLQIHFGENATYNDFIKVLNIFNERDARMYLLDNNTMYFVGKDWVALNKNEFVEGDCVGPPVVYLSEEEIAQINKVFEARNKNSESEQILNNLKTKFLQNKIIYSAYFIFVFVALTYLIKRKST